MKSERNIFLLIVFSSLFYSSAFAQSKNFYSIYFANDKYEIISKEKVKLKPLLDTLVNNLNYTLLITGYSNKIGRKSYNDSLSQMRADVVKDYFISFGIKPQFIISVQGKGEIENVNNLNKNVNNSSIKNRRVDVDIILKKSIPLFDNNIKVGDKITLDNILFEGGHATLLPESYSSLDNLVLTLKRKNKLKISILGHVCCAPKGNDGIDVATGKVNLSAVRANTIYDYLIENGIDAKRLQHKGLKADFPTGNGPKFDRRVEIEITKID